MLSALAARAAGDCQKQMQLSQASGGVFMEAKGRAEVAAHGDQQVFKVSINAPVPDGVPFLVFANGRLTGTVVMAGGSGRLDISNEGKSSLPAMLKPVCSKIRSVRVTTPGGGLVLEGRF
jgi:hypothetical protein